ncbi:hypothetical protein CUR178_04128 [Leishmania enriettii]|uniref:Uncharacterized protein n=1 Tax=Leishmania enriettii TaxID=5663 RepID=A0A836GU75_LEIEN|nr:hypothetical protein CUR178_04128 [Leishmania enriettii]
MSLLVPSAAHGVLTDKEYQQCLRHYLTGSPSRRWIAVGGTPPDLVWNSREETAFESDKVDFSTKIPRTRSIPKAGKSVSGPTLSNVRYRDQYLKLGPGPAPATAAAAHEAASRAGEEYVLISDDKCEQSDNSRNALPSTPSSQQQRAITHMLTKGPAASSSPSPRRSGAGAGSSLASRASQRQSTGSSVVIVSQPAGNVAERSSVQAGAPKGRSAGSKSSSRGRCDGADAVGEMVRKRQRFMEDFLYREE